MVSGPPQPMKPIEPVDWPLAETVSLHWSTFNLSMSILVVFITLENSAQGPCWLFRYVFRRISSSFLIGSFCSDISDHLWVLGPKPRLKSLFSYIWSCLRKAGRISKSWRLELRNSKVLSMLHRYLLMMKAEMTKQALFWAFSLLIKTLSWFSRASFMKL